MIALVSASGGVGKSTLALFIGHVCARQGIKTAVLEGDLQFGDMGYWLGLDVGLSNLAQGQSCIPIPISNNLNLYKAPVLPEVAEDIADDVIRLVSEARLNCDLLVADTGQFWSGLTAELVCSASLVMLIADTRGASIYGAIKAIELCGRLGIPQARIACVLNRASGLPKSEIERIRDALGCDEIFRIADGKTAIETLVSTGRIEELVEEAADPILDTEQMLASLLPRIGIEFTPTTHKRRRRFFS